MNSRVRFVEQMNEIWGISPTLAGDLYDANTWEDLGDIIAASGEIAPIGELVSTLIVFADRLKSPKNEIIDDLDEDEIAQMVGLTD